MPKCLALLFALLVVLIPLTAAAGSAVTVKSLKELIVRELPAGSSKERVLTFVKKHHLATDTGEGWYSPQTNAVYGIVRNVQPWYMWESWFGFRTDIQLVFYLDADGNLKNYTVEKGHTWF